MLQAQSPRFLTQGTPTFHSFTRITVRQHRTKPPDKAKTSLNARQRNIANNMDLNKEFGVRHQKCTQQSRPCDSTGRSANSFFDGRGKRPSFFSNPLLWYSTKLETHPLTTKCLSSGIIAGSGDFLCQFLVHRNTANAASRPDTIHSDNGVTEDFQPDLYRTARFVTLGFFLVAPVVHFWYGSLMSRFPGPSISAVLKRTFVDQAIFAPLFLPTFMLNLMMLEGRPLHEVPSKLQQDVPGALITNWFLWIPAQLINFGFVPGKWQVLFSNMVGFVWNTYLSWKTQEDHS